MKGEEFGRFLFSTGVIGSDGLVKAENELNKELDPALSQMAEIHC